MVFQNSWHTLGIILHIYCPTSKKLYVWNGIVQMLQWNPIGELLIYSWQHILINTSYSSLILLEPRCLQSFPCSTSLLWPKLSTLTCKDFHQIGYLPCISLLWNEVWHLWAWFSQISQFIFSSFTTALKISVNFCPYSLLIVLLLSIFLHVLNMFAYFKSSISSVNIWKYFTSVPNLLDDVRTYRSIIRFIVFILLINWSQHLFVLFCIAFVFN